ncbi:MAG: hypothetical protein AAGK28_02825 [Pseudomonadota bacterium]
MALPPSDKIASADLASKPSAPPVISAPEMIAIAVSLIWVLGVALFFWMTPSEQGGFDGVRFIVVFLAVFMPVAMIWIAASAARSTRIMREEASRLQAAVDGMRKSYIAQQQTAGMALKPAVERKLDEIAQSTKKAENAIATFTTTREPARAPLAPKVEAPGQDQPALELGTPSEALGPPLSTEDLLRALHFPENAEDTSGFAALRRALRDRQAAGLIQAAQDVLTLLSQDGIYMDDLRYDRARPELWRRFAMGERGRGVAGLGGVRDRSSLALSAGRMKQDTIFRDAAHHFLRRFDRMLIAFEPTANDAELAALSDTRTARAFMLLGRVTGMFD